jgi:uncharacterized protein
MALIKVEVVYATREGQDSVLVELESGASALDALRASGLCARHPEIEAGAVRLGVYGTEVAAGFLLPDGARVEIYRPLAIDPKEARRARVAASRRRTARR